MLDKERIQGKLKDLQVFRSRLEGMMPKTFKQYSGSGDMLKSAAERNLQLISDIELDIIVLLYKGADTKLSGDEQSIISAVEGKLGKAARTVRERRALRNSLVHGYSDAVYDRRAFDQGAALQDVDEFVKAVNKLLV